MPTAELFEDDMVPHISGKFGKKGNVMCIARYIVHRDHRFIVDSDNGYDLISAEKVERIDLNTNDSGKINFHPANGVTETVSMVDLNLNTFNKPARAHVLDDAPWVLSLGKRCMEQGDSCVWPRRSRWKSEICSPTVYMPTWVKRSIVQNPARRPR